MEGGEERKVVRREERRGSRGREDRWREERWREGRRGGGREGEERGRRGEEKERRQGEVRNRREWTRGESLKIKAGELIFIHLPRAIVDVPIWCKGTTVQWTQQQGAVGARSSTFLKMNRICTPIARGKICVQKKGCRHENSANLTTRWINTQNFKGFLNLRYISTLLYISLAN